jgi:hypothetical protein
MSQEIVIEEKYLEQLKRIADMLERIERHMAFNNGTMEGLTRTYDRSLNPNSWPGR